MRVTSIMIGENWRETTTIPRLLVGLLSYGPLGNQHKLALMHGPRIFQKATHMTQ